MPPHRVILEVRFKASENLWLCRRRDISGGVLFYETKKADAVKRAAKEARALGTRAQLVVYTKRGTIVFERTYGGDPERRKG